MNTSVGSQSRRCFTAASRITGERGKQIARCRIQIQIFPRLSARSLKPSCVVASLATVLFVFVALPRLQGRAQLIRYADDFVVVCEREDDARKVMDVLPKRFGRFGLTLHPDETRLVCFVRPSRPPGQKRQQDDPAPPQIGWPQHWPRYETGAANSDTSLSANNTLPRYSRCVGTAGLMGLLGTLNVSTVSTKTYCARGACALGSRSPRARMMWDSTARRMIPDPL